MLRLSFALIRAVFLSCAILATEARGALLHRWSFNGDCEDRAGGAAALLKGGARVENGACVFDGKGAYAELPVLNTMEILMDFTIEAWLTWEGGGAWQRIFDYGNRAEDPQRRRQVGKQWFMLTPRSAQGVVEMHINVDPQPRGRTEVFAAGGPLPVGKPVYVAVVFSGNRVKIYIDGEKKAESEILADPSEIANPTHFWLGRSLWEGDPFFKGSISEFRIHDEALSEADILRSASAGPDRFPQALRPAAQWRPSGGVLMTRWGKKVSVDSVHPEYPRPQLRRPDWKNLNGLWEFRAARQGEEPPFGKTLPRRILVPFPVESALSGVGQRPNRMWYRRLFEVPEAWTGKRILLHFGAVDWEAVVYLNGTKLGSHRGGYTPFSFDITEALKAHGPQELIVGVYDPTDEGDQPRGKQSRRRYGIWYTSSSGIWQTVWLEPVPDAYLRSIRVTPDLRNAQVNIEVEIEGARQGDRIRAVVSASGKEVVAREVALSEFLGLWLRKARPWSPQDPFLYDLTVELKRSGKVIDRVSSYFGMRSITVRAGRREALRRILLNGKFVFQIGPLDQGFWPDGLYTAPSDEALRWDIEITKKLGFNATRKHVKIEPERWYYWCDKLGLMVWQDIPSAGNRTPESRREFKREALEMITALRNHPSIVGWVLFNEGWGQFEDPGFLEEVRKADPTRFVTWASGWYDKPLGDVVDVHCYPGPGWVVPEGDRAAVIGEFGGAQLGVKGHTWTERGAWGYFVTGCREDLEDAYEDLLRQVWERVGAVGISGAIYTQLTDVERECNGLVTYDREVVKVDPERIRAANRGVWSEKMFVRVLLPTARGKKSLWRYTFTEPPPDWMAPDFDDSSWKEGPGGFGKPGTVQTRIGTVWTGRTIWLRKTFDLPWNLWPLPKRHLKDHLTWTNTFKLLVHHDDEADVYLNGFPAARLPGWHNYYEEVPVLEEAGASLKPGRNVIAIKCTQVAGDQYIDAGLLQVREKGGRKYLRLPSERVWFWYRHTEWPCGVNYVPSTAVNSTEMWQAESFDPQTIDRELGWAEEIGFNSCRVFLQFLVWKADPAGFKKRFERFLSIAEKHGITVVPCLFDDCAFSGREPYLGKQAAPVPGVHNSGWTPSPGHKRVVDRSAWPDLERYVKDVIGTWRIDKRILFWDLYNEPGNAGMGRKSLPLLKAAFRWARSAWPRQPVTVAVWTPALRELNTAQLTLSDIISFHNYGGPAEVRRNVERLRFWRRPIVCTEWMRRPYGTYRNLLPFFKKERIGCWSWGLVAGKTQTFYPWGSKPGTPEPKRWFHDLLRKDGSPFDPEEVEFIRRTLRSKDK